MNFSFSEILLILLIALLVIKPHQLPEVAEQLVKIIRAMQHFMKKIKDEVNELVQIKNPPKSNSGD